MTAAAYLARRNFSDYQGLCEAAQQRPHAFEAGEISALGTIALAASYAPTLYEACREEYGADRGNNFCGPFNMTLGHILKEDLQLPLTRAESRPARLQLYINRLGSDHDQTSLVHHVGDSTVTILDGVIRLADTKTKPGLEALFIETTLEKDLSYYFEYMGLRPLADETSTLPIIHQAQLYPDEQPIPYDEMVAVMHTEAVFGDEIRFSCGTVDITSFWGPRTRRIYRETRRRTGTIGPLMRKLSG